VAVLQEAGSLLMQRREGGNARDPRKGLRYEINYDGDFVIERTCSIDLIFAYHIFYVQIYRHGLFFELLGLWRIITMPSINIMISTFFIAFHNSIWFGHVCTIELTLVFSHEGKHMEAMGMRDVTRDCWCRG